MDFLERLHWRYATKRMLPGAAVPEPVVERILEAARLAPSSSGLQPFEIVLVTSAAVKERLAAAAWGQSQLKDASHVLVFAAWSNYTAERIDAYFDLSAEVRGSRPEGAEAYRKRLHETVLPRAAEENHHHAAKQAYLAMGFALAAAALEGVDSTPMEGFDPAQVDAILDLPSRGLHAVTIVPLGYRDTQNDWLLPMKKVRRPRAGFVTTVR
jgi:nitroreductase